MGNKAKQRTKKIMRSKNSNTPICRKDIEMFFRKLQLVVKESYDVGQILQSNDSGNFKEKYCPHYTLSHTESKKQAALLPERDSRFVHTNVRNEGPNTCRCKQLFETSSNVFPSYYKRIPSFIGKCEVELSFIQAIVWLKSVTACVPQIPVEKLQQLFGKQCNVRPNYNYKNRHVDDVQRVFNHDSTYNVESLKIIIDKTLSIFEMLNNGEASITSSFKNISDSTRNVLSPMINKSYIIYPEDVQNKTFGFVSSLKDRNESVAELAKPETRNTYVMTNQEKREEYLSKPYIIPDSNENFLSNLNEFFEKSNDMQEHQTLEHEHTLSKNFNKRINNEIIEDTRISSTPKNDADVSKVHGSVSPVISPILWLTPQKQDNANNFQTSQVQSKTLSDYDDGNFEYQFNGNNFCTPMSDTAAEKQVDDTAYSTWIETLNYDVAIITKSTTANECISDANIEHHYSLQSYKKHEEITVSPSLIQTSVCRGRLSMGKHSLSKKLEPVKDLLTKRSGDEDETSSLKNIFDSLDNVISPISNKLYTDFEDIQNKTSSFTSSLEDNKVVAKLSKMKISTDVIINQEKKKEYSSKSYMIMDSDEDSLSYLNSGNDSLVYLNKLFEEYEQSSKNSNKRVNNEIIGDKSICSTSKNGVDISNEYKSVVSLTRCQSCKSILNEINDECITPMTSQYDDVVDKMETSNDYLINLTNYSNINLSQLISPISCMTRQEENNANNFPTDQMQSKTLHDSNDDFDFDSMPEHQTFEYDETSSKNSTQQINEKMIEDECIYSTLNHDVDNFQTDRMQSKTLYNSNNDFDFDSMLEHQTFEYDQTSSKNLTQQVNEKIIEDKSIYSTSKRKGNETKQDYDSAYSTSKIETFDYDLAITTKPITANKYVSNANIRHCHNLRPRKKHEKVKNSSSLIQNPVHKGQLAAKNQSSSKKCKSQPAKNLSKKKEETFNYDVAITTKPITPNKHVPYANISRHYNLRPRKKHEKVNISSSLIQKPVHKRQLSAKTQSLKNRESELAKNLSKKKKGNQDKPSSLKNIFNSSDNITSSMINELSTDPKVIQNNNKGFPAEKLFLFKGFSSKKRKSELAKNLSKKKKGNQNKTSSLKNIFDSSDNVTSLMINESGTDPKVIQNNNKGLPAGKQSLSKKRKSEPAKNLSKRKKGNQNKTPSLKNIFDSSYNVISSMNNESGTDPENIQNNNKGLPAKKQSLSKKRKLEPAKNPSKKKKGNQNKTPSLKNIFDSSYNVTSSMNNESSTDPENKQNNNKGLPAKKQSLSKKRKLEPAKNPSKKKKGNQNKTPSLKNIFDSSYNVTSSIIIESGTDPEDIQINNNKGLPAEKLFFFKGFSSKERKSKPVKNLSKKKQKNKDKVISARWLDFNVELLNAEHVILASVKVILSTLCDKKTAQEYIIHGCWKDSLEEQAVNAVLNIVDIFRKEKKPDICIKEIEKAIIETLDEMLTSIEIEITIWINRIQIILQFCNLLSICVKTINYLITILKTLQHVLIVALNDNERIAEIDINQLYLVSYALDNALRKYRIFVPRNKKPVQDAIPYVGDLWKMRYTENETVEYSSFDLDAIEKKWINVLQEFTVTSVKHLIEFTDVSFSLYHILISA